MITSKQSETNTVAREQVVADRLQRYFEDVLDRADQRISRVVRLGTGISRETFRVDLEGEGDVFYVLQIEPAFSFVPGDSGRVEYEVCSRLAGASVPVPRMVRREEDQKWVGSSFNLAYGLSGAENEPKDLRSRFGAEARHIVSDSFEILGRLGGWDMTGSGLSEILSATEKPAWERQLDYWQGEVEANPVRPSPLLQTVLRWLRRHPPRQPTRTSVVHGDFRIGNYVYDSSGVTGVVDWEMAHAGDPMEDLAWAVLHNWRFGDAPDLIAGVLTVDEAIACWEKGSGTHVDRAALNWWTLLVHVKAIALWAVVIRKLDAGEAAPFRYNNLPLITMPRQEAWLAQDVKGII